MSYKTSRARVVNFRLTESEYESIVFACQAEGVRTVSEFARDIVLSRARGETTNRVQVSQWLVGLSTDFAKIKADVAQVLGILEPESVKVMHQNKLVENTGK
ncbi:MAG TPA: hypothetical protein VHZ55_29750 [Bryobacteraceae bacterium]|nr:hypothetical protein [Bryobacteraceae bacterium]